MGKFFSWLGNFIKFCVDAVLGFFVAIWDLFISLITAVGQWILDFIEYIWGWIEFGYFMALDLLIGNFLEFLEKLVEKFGLDESSLESFQNFIEYIQIANRFLPLDIIGGCAVTFFTVLMVWVVYKFIKSWLPTVSGT
ncbi:MAG: hypothetical protein Q4C70_05290 [Planctomycetia bacterium]|nr:hypothetical protein [Planctomycetia bacterium]